MNMNSNDLTTLGENELTLEQQQKVQEVKNKIDLTDGTSVITYGSSSQQDVAAFADKILKEVKMKDSGTVGQTIETLVLKVKEIDVKTLSKKEGFFSKIPLIGNLFDQIEKFKRQFNTVSLEIENIVNQLNTAKITILSDITYLENLYDKNSDFYNELTVYIEAGEQKLKEAQETVLPALQQKAQNTNHALAVQELNTMIQYLNRFEKKIHDLKLTRHVTLQTAPQIRLIQETNEVLADKIQSSIVNTVPMWKQQMSLALMIDRQKQATQLQKSVTDANNELMQNVSEMLKQSSTDVAIEAERSVIDIETLQKVQDNFISTLESVINIQKEGKQKRQLAQQELTKMENEMKQRIQQLANERI